MMTSRDDSQ